MRTKAVLFLSLLCACSTTPNPWITDSLVTGTPSFSRIRYVSPQPHPPLAFEMVKIGEEIGAFISLNRFRLASSTKISFTIADQLFEEEIPVHEGGMRLRLSEATTQQLIQALQDGQKIGILVDDFEEILDPDQFSRSFAKFLDENHFFQTLLRGPNS